MQKIAANGAKAGSAQHTVDVRDGGPTATITLLAENRLRDLERLRVHNYTDADQQAEYPGDRGFEYVPALQTMSIPWGVSA